MMPRGASEQAVTSGGPLFLASFILHSKQSLRTGDRVYTPNLSVLPILFLSYPVLLFTHVPEINV